MKNKFILILVIIVTIIITCTLGALLFITKSNKDVPEVDNLETPENYDDYLKLLPLTCYLIEDITSLTYEDMDEEALSFYGCQAVLMLCKQTDEVCIPVLNKAWYKDNKVNILLHNTMGTQCYRVIMDIPNNLVYVRKIGSIYNMDFPGIYYGTVSDGADYQAIENVMIVSGFVDKSYTLISVTDHEATIQAEDGEQHTITF